MYEFSILNDNDFIKFTREEHMETYLKYKNKTQDFHDQYKYYNQLEKYISNITAANYRIIYIFEELILIRKLIVNMDNNNLLESKFKIPRTSYLKYNLSNFYVRVVSLRDLSQKLINIVYNLGIDYKSCNYSTVLKNEMIINKKIKIIYEKLGKKVLQEISEKRHEFVHDGFFDDKEISDLKIYSMLEFLKYDGEFVDDFDFTKDVVERDILNFLNNWIKFLEDFFNDFFNECFLGFKKELDKK